MSFSNALPGRNDQPTEGIAAFGTVAAAPDFAPLPPGLYAACVLKGEYAATKAGKDAYRLKMEVTEGEHAGKTVVRTWTFGAKALPYTTRDLAPFGLTTTAALLSPFPEPGREYLVKLVVALQKGDDGVTRNDIKRIDIVRIGESPEAKFLLPDTTEGGR